MVLLTGDTEPPVGLAFVAGDLSTTTCILACWGDGAMLTWNAPPQETALGVSQTPCRRQQPLLLNRTPPAASADIGATKCRLAESNCQSAPPALRCPEGFLERLLPSPPPKWAEVCANTSHPITDFVR